MIKAVMTNSMTFFGLNDIPGGQATDTLNEMNKKVGDITVVSSYYGTLAKGFHGSIEALTSMDVKEGDTLVMITAQMKGKRPEWPEGFMDLSPGDKNKGLSLSAAFKVWREGTPTTFLMDKAKNSFFCLLTLRDVTGVIEAKRRAADCKILENGLAPRVNCPRGGAVITAYTHKDSKRISLIDQQSLATITAEGGSLAVGISEAKTSGISKRFKANTGNTSDDISMSISIC
jgi:hypothetical protein